MREVKLVQASLRACVKRARAWSNSMPAQSPTHSHACGLPLANKTAANMASGASVAYILLYNIYQAIGWFAVCGLSLAVLAGCELPTAAFDTTVRIVTVLQLSSFLEIAHSCFGWTKSSVGATLTQVLGRNFCLFCSCLPFLHLHSMIIIDLLFLAWGLIECVRYPLYLLGDGLRWLTWLRYTLPIVLYPIGYVCELIIYVRARELSSAQDWFAVHMPNRWNFAFSYSAFLSLFIPFSFCGFVSLYLYVIDLRRKKLLPSPPRVHAKMT